MKQRLNAVLTRIRYPLHHPKQLRRTIAAVVVGGFAIGLSAPAFAQADNRYNFLTRPLKFGDPLNTFRNSSSWSEPALPDMTFQAPTPSALPPSSATNSSLPVVGVSRTPGLPTVGGPSLLAQAPESPSYLGNRHVVIVNSADQTTLARVQQVEPGAYVRTFTIGQVIQAGSFQDELGAQRRINQLATIGVYGVTRRSSELVDLNPPSSSWSPSYDNNYPWLSGSGTLLAINRRGEPGSLQPQAFKDAAYFVIVPQPKDQLQTVATQIRRFGVNGFCPVYKLVCQTTTPEIWIRTLPRGSHVAVGPFKNRGDAEQFGAALREVTNFDARVYYGR